jgi:hypothetical protein
MRLLVTDPGLFTKMAETSGHLRNHFDAWYRVVILYCARSLTFPSDKLPAIAGIARVVQSHFGGEYGAGLWREDLAMGLCWTVADHVADEPAVSGQEYIAPSWSWACIKNRRIQYHPIYYSGSGRKSHECVQVLDWEFSYPTGAVIPFGQVTSGVLTLHGHLQHALLIPPLESTESVWVPKPLWHAFMVHAHTASIIGEVSIDTLDTYNALNARYQDLVKDESESDHRMKLGRALPVSYLATYAVDCGEYRRIYALVLAPHDIKKHEYRRIGLLCVKVPVPHTDRLAVMIGGSSGDHDRQTVHMV